MCQFDHCTDTDHHHHALLYELGESQTPTEPTRVEFTPKSGTSRRTRRRRWCLVRNLLMPEFRLFIFIYFILPSSYGFDPSVPAEVTSSSPYLLFHSKPTNFTNAINGEQRSFFPQQTLLVKQKGESSGSGVSGSSEDDVEGDGNTNEGPSLKNDKEEGLLKKISGHDVVEIVEGSAGSPGSRSVGSSESEGNNPSLNYHFNDTASSSRRRRTLLYENWANSILLNDPSSDSNQFDKTSSSGTNATKKGRQRSGNRRGTRSICKISEFACPRGKCIHSDKFCDGIDDCGDSSDEPHFCTPCNRTYYGEWGITYTLSLDSSTISAATGHLHDQQMHSQQGQPIGGTSGSHQKKTQHYPHFVCQLSFAAAGENFGDLVQIMFDSINIGQFASSTHDGCPDGSLQVAEISRPITGGKWCGSGEGYSVYFSEMSAIALTLTVGSQHSALPGGHGSSSVNTSSSGRKIPSFPGGGGGSDPGLIPMTGTSGGHKPFGSNLPSSSGSGGPVGGGTYSPGISPGRQGLLLTHPSSAAGFVFKIRYKFIPHSLATVRYGPHGNPVERGVIVPGAFCSRDFEACHRRRCKIQSPNYPGLFPRNVSCHFTIRHRDKQPCKHILVQVGQLKSHKMQLKTPPVGTRHGMMGSSGLPGSPGSSIGGGGPFGGPPQVSIPPQQQSILFQEDALVSWEDCSQGNRDSLTFYDGNSVMDPVLLVVCGGGHVPQVTSSSSEILVVFRATPYGNPMDLKPTPPYPEPLRGFELDVDIITVDSDTADYSNFKNNCTFIFVSQPKDACLMYKPQEHGGNWITGKIGKVTNPRHTIPPNTTCRYEFQGTKHETVWIYFVAYSRKSSMELNKQFPDKQNCSGRLTIRDGIAVGNEPLLGNFCDHDLPKLCNHKALQEDSRDVRACTETESYISAGSRLIIEQSFLEGTALRPIQFQFYYEFVSRHPGADRSCDRYFDMSKMKSKGSIRTTDNVFDFGRGGKTNLTCTYTFALGTYEGLKLTVKNSSFGDRPCRTVTDFETGRFMCNYVAQSPSATNSNNNSSNGPSNNSSSEGDPLGSQFQPKLPTFPFSTFIHVSSIGLLPPPRSELNFYESIWGGKNNISLHRHCLCSNSSGSSGYTFTFLGRKVVLTFTVESMTARDSYENYFAHLDYEVLKGEGCRGDNHYMKTESGVITLESSFSHGPKPPNCDQYPWLLEAKENHSLYLRIYGFPMLEEKRVHHHPYSSPAYGKPVNESSRNSNNNEIGEYAYASSSSNYNVSGGGGSSSPMLLPGLAKFQIDRICPTTKNRIFIYDGNNQLIQKICPASISSLNKKTPAQIVEIYSEDFGQFHSPLFPPPKSRFVIDFVGKELGSYRVQWLELMSAKMKTTLMAMDYDPRGGRDHRMGNNITLFHGTEQDQLRRGTPSWEETLSKMFEGQNGVNQDSQIYTIPGEGTPLGSPICPSYCPELQACISDKLWCDGEIHCPISELDEKQCDNFWATLNQLMSPAVYIPLLAAVSSALFCCVLVSLCVATKRMIINMRAKGQLGPSSSASSSRTSTVDRRLPSRDYFYDPHEPVS